MKPYLIQYDLNYREEQGLLMLVYAKSFKEAIKKLEKNVSKKSGNNDYFLVNYKNLTIE